MLAAPVKPGLIPLDYLSLFVRDVVELVDEVVDLVVEVFAEAFVECTVSVGAGGSQLFLAIYRQFCPRSTR